jgi:hypothetical protein
MVLDRFEHNIDIKQLFLEQPEVSGFWDFDPAKYLTEKHWEQFKAVVLKGWRREQITTPNFLGYMAACCIVDGDKAQHKLALESTDVDRLDSYMELEADQELDARIIKNQADYLLIRGDNPKRKFDYMEGSKILNQKWKEVESSPKPDQVLELAEFLESFKIFYPGLAYESTAMWTIFDNQLKDFCAKKRWDAAADLAASMRVISPEKYEGVKLSKLELEDIKRYFLTPIPGNLADLELARNLKLLAAEVVDFSKSPPFTMHKAEQPKLYS